MNRDMLEFNDEFDRHFDRQMDQMEKVGKLAAWTAGVGLVLAVLFTLAVIGAIIAVIVIFA